MKQETYDKWKSIIDSVSVNHNPSLKDISGTG